MVDLNSPIISIFLVKVLVCILVDNIGRELPNKVKFAVKQKYNQNQQAIILMTPTDLLVEVNIDRCMYIYIHTCIYIHTGKSSIFRDPPAEPSPAPQQHESGGGSIWWHWIEAFDCILSWHFKRQNYKQPI